MAKRVKSIWGLPGWPWELEFLAFIFVLCALLIPYFYQSEAATEQETIEKEKVTLVKKAALEDAPEIKTDVWFEEMKGFFWALVIVIAYFGHIILASTSYNYVSTPISHLLAPLIFVAILYYRLIQGRIIGSGIWTPVGWFFGVLIITLLVARIRMARHMLNFRHVDWEINDPTQMDATFFELLPTFRPLFYFPHIFRACAEGIIIEGWFYILPIAFDMVEGMSVVEEPSMSSQGHFFATSNRQMVEINLYEDATPIYISPKDPETFVTYCSQYLGTEETA